MELRAETKNAVERLHSISALHESGLVETDVALDMILREAAEIEDPYLIFKHASKPLGVQVFMIYHALAANRDDDVTRAWRDVGDPQVRKGLQRLLQYITATLPVQKNAP